MLTRGLRVPDRVIAHLLGDDVRMPRLAGLIDRRGRLPNRSLDPAGACSCRRRTPDPLEGAAHWQRRSHRQSRPWREFGTAAVVPGSWAASRRTRSSVVASLAVREALLGGAGLVAGPIEQVAESHADVVRWLAETEIPVLLFGSSTWDPQWSTRNPLAVDAPVLTVGDRIELWARELGAVRPQRHGGA